jgi:hypothetical protein
MAMKTTSDRRINAGRRRLEISLYQFYQFDVVFIRPKTAFDRRSPASSRKIDDEIIDAAGDEPSWDSMIR